jgi:alpha-tubulin suppressor-like RCC1 family protein
LETVTGLPWTEFTDTHHNDEIDCYAFVDGNRVQQASISNLGSLHMKGDTAQSGDQIFFWTTGSPSLVAMGNGNPLNLAGSWSQAEFNVVGFGNYAQVGFNAGTSIEVKLQVDNGNQNPPSCGIGMFTGESNNLNLLNSSSVAPPSCCSIPSGIVYTESNDPNFAANANNSICACPPGYTWNQSNSACECSTGATPRTDGTCPPVTNPVISISAGGFDACAVLQNGTANCWGGDVIGELGTGTGTSGVDNAQPLPAQVQNVAGAATQIFSDKGGYFANSGDTCALVPGSPTGATVQCWGNNAFDALGYDQSISFSTVAEPVPALSSTPVSDIAPGGAMCVVLPSGVVQCWGENDFGQLGTGSTSPSFVQSPVTVSLAASAALPSGNLHTIAGGTLYECVVLVDGRVQCWGANNVGQLGNGTTSPSAPTPPVFVTGLSDAVAISAGFQHTCALRQSGDVVCWGDNGSADLGDPTNSNPYVTVPVDVGLSNVIGLAAGDFHTCVVLAGGSVTCWGSNALGELGIGSTDVSLHGPAPSLLSSNATAIAASGQHTCALLADGTVDCWGENNLGQLGIGTTSTAEPTPVRVHLSLF